jgi:hypothetical protein
VKTACRHHIAAIGKTKRIKNETMKSLGQVAYEAYATKVDWKSPFTGQTLKDWDTLMIMNPIVAEAWECAEFDGCWSESRIRRSNETLR